MAVQRGRPRLSAGVEFIDENGGGPGVPTKIGEGQNVTYLACCRHQRRHRSLERGIGQLQEITAHVPGIWKAWLEC
jgi:hypothetical protein